MRIFTELWTVGVNTFCMITTAFRRFVYGFINVLRDMFGLKRMEDGREGVV